MVLEATMIIVDNSENSRNGDYLPSRFEAQSDAVSLIFNAKTQANPESSVGLMSMGGAQPEVLTTLTTDFGKVLDGMHRTKIRGSSNLSTALNVAGLALKHRQNKAQHQRIIVFTCSPLSEDEKTCIKLAKRMKKNTIAVDIVAFGDLADDTVKKVQAFHENIKGSGDGSHIAVIPPGPNLLSDSIVATDILAGDGVGAGAGGSGGGEGGGEGSSAAPREFFQFDVDPGVDPELALALRMSLEDEERRREQEQQEQGRANFRRDLETVPEGEEKEGGEGDSGDKKEDGDAGPSGGKMDTS